MQKELDALRGAAGGGAVISILGVNAIGLESGNAENCAGRTLPWLQDVDAINAWERWQVTWRDVVILDPENRRVAVYNLTTYDLGDSTHYARLRDLLLEKAAE